MAIQYKKKCGEASVGPAIGDVDVAAVFELNSDIGQLVLLANPHPNRPSSTVAGKPSSSLRASRASHV